MRRAGTIEADRLVFPYTPREAAEYAQHWGWENAALHGSSSRLLNVNGNPSGNPAQMGMPSVYQNLPLDADTLLRWLGGGVYPAGFGVANVLAIYGCDTASPLVDSLGLGPNLVAGAGPPLAGRECVGLGQAGSWTSKVGVEMLRGAGYNFVEAVASGFGNVPDNSIKCFGIVMRAVLAPAVAGDRLFGSWCGATPSWFLDTSTGNDLRVVVWTPAGLQFIGPFAFNVFDNGWHYIVVEFDTNVPQLRVCTDLGNSAWTAYAGSLAGVNQYALGVNFSNAIAAQVAYNFVTDREVTPAMGTAFWRHAQVPVPFLHARLNPLVAPISASRVAAWSGGNVGQAALGYDASLVTAPLGNPLGSGYVCEDGATFEPIGSNSMYANTAVGGAAKTSVDGPSAMRDGVRMTMAAAFGPATAFGYLPAGGAPIVGVSNIPWRADISYRRATVNTTGRMALFFSGSAGGSETFILVTDNATPVDWTRNGGTCTPVRADQLTVGMLYGAAANLDDCDFGEPAVIKNRATPSLAWRRVGTAAAAVTTTPAYSVVNTGNRYFQPLRGRIRIAVGQFQGTNGATFLQFGASAAAGSLCLDYSGGQLRLRMYDAAAGLIATLNCGAVNAARHVFDILYDSRTPIRGGAAGGYIIVKEGSTILGEGGAAWAAQVAAVTPLYIGSLSGTNAARCLIELQGLFVQPGGVLDTP